MGRSRGRLTALSGWNPSPLPKRIDLHRWQNHDLSVAWVGHATMLVRIGGMTVLTDPVFSQRVGPGAGVMTFGPRRRFAPALPIEMIPRIDVILISHAHFDHLDRPTLARLSRRSTVITADRCGDLVRDLGFRDVRELKWDETTRVGSLRFTAWPVVHWGARTFDDSYRGYNAFLLESDGPAPRRLLFGGDTAYHSMWRGRGSVDAAILGIGAYNPYVQGHTTPEQAWEMAGHLGASAIVPMHHSTFQLSYEPWDEPMQRLLNVAGTEGKRVAVRTIGDVWGMGE